MGKNKGAFQCAADSDPKIRYMWNDSTPNIGDKGDADNVAASYIPTSPEIVCGKCRSVVDIRASPARNDKLAIIIACRDKNCSRIHVDGVDRWAAWEQLDLSLDEHSNWTAEELKADDFRIRRRRRLRAGELRCSGKK
jgi:hypothetical protein